MSTSDDLNLKKAPGFVIEESDDDDYKNLAINIHLPVLTIENTNSSNQIELLNNQLFDNKNKLSITHHSFAVEDLNLQTGHQDQVQMDTFNYAGKHFNDIDESEIFYANQPSTKTAASGLVNSKLIVNENYTLPVKFNYDLNKIETYMSGQPLTNGYIMNKINPGLISSEFSYLNRNKLLNRRLVIKKQMENSRGLQPIIRQNSNFSKATNSFQIANPDLIDSIELNADKTKLTQEVQKGLKTTCSYRELVSQLKKSNSFIIIAEKETSIDSTGPAPNTYHIPRKPPHQKTAPMFTFAKRCFNEKAGGARTAWEKEWFNSRNPFTLKTDFNREQAWPSPAYYRVKSTVGETNQFSYPQAPSHTMGARIGKDISVNSENFVKKKLVEEYEQYIRLIDQELMKTNSLKTNTGDQTALNNKRLIIEYLIQRHKGRGGDVSASANYVMKSAPQITIKLRRHGTELGVKPEKTPGPKYNYTKFENVRKSAPKFSLPQAKLKHNSNFSIGPFSAF